MKLELSSIGIVRSCFKERFGIPRQGSLAPSAWARLELKLEEGEAEDALRGLEGFSHVWLVFAFHEAKGAKALVRPPRLGGARKLGVFATRSPHRPNPLGLTLARLERIEGATLHLSGVDLLDGTPVFDVKPYLPYSDAVADARAGWVPEERRLEVSFEPEAGAECERRPGLRELLEQLLAPDPRPAFQAGQDGERYAFRLSAGPGDATDLDVHWQVTGTRCRVLEVRILQT